jgi:O-antigen/teichoic acid export membrane protein
MNGAFRVITSFITVPSGGSVNFARNSLYNLLGGLIPAVAALLTVPVIINRLGEIQYGVFALVTSVVGYFAILDINVTASSVKYLAEYHSRKEAGRVAQVLSFSGLIYFAIGLLGGLGIFFFAEFLATVIFRIPPQLQQTATLTLQVAGFAFLFGQLQTYLQSVPQALQRYDLSGRLEGLFGAAVSISTVIVVLAGGGLVEIMYVRLLLSILNCVLLVRVIRKILPGVGFAPPDRTIAKALLSFSAFSYLSRLATITYLNSDKLLIAALVDMRALALYTVPFLLTNRLFSIVYRLGQVIFPVASALSAQGRTESLRATYLGVTRYIVYLNACLCISLCVFSRELLHYWAGPVFGPEAAVVLVIVATAVFVDSLTNLPSLVNDGLGKPRNTGLFAVARAAIGLSAAYLGISNYGFIGAAWAQLAVSLVMSAAFLKYIHGRTVPVSLHELMLAYTPTAVPFLIVFPISLAFYEREVLPLPLFLLGITCFCVISVAWGLFVVCLPEHRGHIYTQLRYWSRAGSK